MSLVTDTLPQSREPIRIITFAEVVRSLPDRLDYDINVWIGGKLARYGQTSENLIFLIEGEGDPSLEMRQYFSKVGKGFDATVSHRLHDHGLGVVRVYNEGRLIVDRETLCLTELPTATKTLPILRLEQVLSVLPKKIERKETVYLTGSLVRFGWSGNDADFMVDSDDTEVYRELRDLFRGLIGWKVDVGNADMPEREPVYKFKIYEGGKCLL